MKEGRKEGTKGWKRSRASNGNGGKRRQKERETVIDKDI
jgi:hypothetical protein